jgi:hypothetical protein
MSHITTVETKIILKNEDMVKQAVKAMAKDFQGMTFEQIAPDVIKVRYAPIEGYQRNGNLQFVKNAKTGIWEMQVDHWRCAEEVQKVKDAFFVAYQEAATITHLKKQGYRITSKREGKNLVMTAVRY